MKSPDWVKMCDVYRSKIRDKASDVNFKKRVKMIIPYIRTDTRNTKEIRVMYSTQGIILFDII